jgi:hypothetical protein
VRHGAPVLTLPIVMTSIEHRTLFARLIKGA